SLKASREDDDPTIVVESDFWLLVLLGLPGDRGCGSSKNSLFGLSSFAFPFSRLEGLNLCDGEFNGDYDTSYCCLVVIIVLLVVAFDVVVVGHVVAENMVVRKHIVKSGVCCGKLKLADDVIVGDGYVADATCRVFITVNKCSHDDAKIEIVANEKDNGDEELVNLYISLEH
ncbi:hypothetical protein Tco_1267184, partial [Tanacetum coccineum]